METFISKCGKKINTAYAAKVFNKTFCSEKGGVIRSLLAQVGYVYMSVVDERSRIQIGRASCREIV